MDAGGRATQEQLPNKNAGSRSISNFCDSRTSKDRLKAGMPMAFTLFNFYSKLQKS